MYASQSFRDLFGTKRILWQHVFGYYCMGLDRFCPIGAVASVDFGREYGWIEERTSIRMFSVEAESGVRPKPKEGDVERIIPALKPLLLDAMRKQGGAWSLVCPLPNAKLDSLAAEVGCAPACPRADVGNWLYSKANFFSGLDLLGLPRLPGRWLAGDELNYSELRASMGPKLVMQKSMGGGGEGTVFIASEKDLLEAAHFIGRDAMWVTPEIEGPSINLNAIVLDHGVVVGSPNLQLVGLEMLECRPGMYCGNDFTSASNLSKPVLNHVREQTERIGGWLATLGFRGLFGLDFVLDSNSERAYALDLNPRWQGSTAIGAQARSRASRLPLAAAEIAWRLGAVDESEILSRADRFFGPLRASQMSFRLSNQGWKRVNGEVRPGVYSVAPAPSFQRPGIEMDDLRSEDEVLVTGAVPLPGCKLGPESYVLRVYAERPVIDLTTAQPLPWARQFADAMYSALCLEPIEAPASPNRAN